MRLCRFRKNGDIAVGFYDEAGVLELSNARALARRQTGAADFKSNDLLDYLPPDGRAFADTSALAAALREIPIAERHRTPLAEVELLTPIPKPNKILLLAGNYAKHVEERGRVAVERQETFPYVFMKPPTTTLTDPGKPVHIPKISPAHIDWELELAVVIGKSCKGVSETDALSVVAGYTVLNDITDRKFKPNPARKSATGTNSSDWLHGKWMDGFCPCGPCITSADAIPDPQTLAMKLTLNGQTRQDANTNQQIFSVAAVIAFISSFVTLEPGDIISTGTPSGVGSASNTYLKPGDELVAWIEGIGELHTPVIAE